MTERSRKAVRALLLLPILQAATGLVVAAAQAFSLAGSLVDLLIVFVVIPFASWIAWRAAVGSVTFARWLRRGTLVLTPSSIAVAVVGAAWPALVAITTDTPVTEVHHHAGLLELGGIGLCISGILIGILTAATLWAPPIREA